MEKRKGRCGEINGGGTEKKEVELWRNPRCENSPSSPSVRTKSRNSSSSGGSWQPHCIVGREVCRKRSNKVVRLLSRSSSSVVSCGSSRVCNSGDGRIHGDEGRSRAELLQGIVERWWRGGGWKCGKSDEVKKVATARRTICLSAAQT